MKTPEIVIAKLVRQYASLTGMDPEDLAQELRLVVLEGATHNRALLNRCINLARDYQKRQHLVPTVPLEFIPDADGVLNPNHDAPAAGLTPEQAVEAEAEELTLERLRPDLESARKSHKPLSQVRLGLSRSEWLARLEVKDPTFPRHLRERGVDAMLALPDRSPVALRASQKAYRDNAFRRGAGARGARTGVVAGRPVDVEQVSGRADWAAYKGTGNARRADWPAALSSITPRARNARTLDYISGSYLAYGRPTSNPETPGEAAAIAAYVARTKGAQNVNS